MGAVFRFTYCQVCGKRYRKPVEICSCGRKSFRFSDWYIRVKVHGRNYEEKVGSKTLARQILVRRESEVIDGKFQIKKDKKILMRDFVLGDYWELYASRKKSYKTYKHRIKNHILPVFGNMFIHQIAEVDIERWLARQDEIYPVSTINRHLALMKSIYKMAIKWCKVDNNPTVGIKLRKENNEVVKFLRPEEVKAMVEFAPNWYTKAFIIFGVGTLLRQSNLFGLKWKHLDFENKLITIPGALAKNSEPVTIPMIDEVYNLLRELPKSIRSEFVLTNPKTGTKFKDIYYSFRKARDKAGIDERFTPHGLRHTGASWLIMAGVPSRTVMTLMNVKSEAVLKRYAHLTPQHLQEQAAKLSGFLNEKSDQKGGYRVDMNK